MIYAQAGANDIERLAELRIDYLTEDSGQLSESVAETVRSGVADYLRRCLGQSVFAYTAKDGGNIVACAFLVVTEKPMSPAFITGMTGLVLNVYTKPEHRHMGYARRLMELLMGDAERMGLSAVELKATEAGYGLYAALGFEESGSKYRPTRWVPERYRR